MDTESVIAWSTAALSLLTFGLLVATTVGSIVALKIYRGTTDPVVVIYSSMTLGSVNIVVKNIGNGIAHGVVIRSRFNIRLGAHFDKESSFSKPFLIDGCRKIGVLAPGECRVYEWADNCVNPNEVPDCKMTICYRRSDGWGSLLKYEGEISMKTFNNAYIQGTAKDSEKISQSLDRIQQGVSSLHLEQVTRGH